MKIVYFATYYEPYLKAFYADRPGLAAESYTNQLETLISDFFGAFGSYVLGARSEGHEAHLIVPNCRPLQQQWTHEHGLPFNEATWQFEIPILQTEKLMPDIFFIGSMFQYYGPFMDKIAKYARKIVGWISCPMPAGIFSQAHPSLILTSAPTYAKIFREQGIASELLPAFFDPRVLDRLGKVETTESWHDLTFIGGISPAHTNRIKAIRRLVQRTPIELYGYGFSETFRYPLPVLNRLLKHPVMHRYRGEAWGLRMYSLLSRSRITFNSHIDMAAGFGINMRMYEATGMGTLLLTDGKNKQQYFADDEVVYYSNLDDAIDKIDYFLRNESERFAISAAGQKRTLRDYNAENTVRKMLGYFQDYT